jgi:hypothetical protein
MGDEGIWCVSARMGRTLDSMDIHSPSVSAPAPAETSDTRLSLNGLLEEKTVLEATLSELNAILEKHGVGCVSFNAVPDG